MTADSSLNICAWMDLALPPNRNPATRRPSNPGALQWLPPTPLLLACLYTCSLLAVVLHEGIGGPLAKALQNSGTPGQGNASAFAVLDLAGHSFCIVENHDGQLAAGGGASSSSSSTPTNTSLVVAAPMGSNGTNSSFLVTAVAAPGSSTAASMASAAAGAGGEAGWLAGFSTQDYWVVKVGSWGGQAAASMLWAGTLIVAEFRTFQF